MGFWLAIGCRRHRANVCAPARVRRNAAPLPPHRPFGSGSAPPPASPTPGIAPPVVCFAFGSGAQGVARCPPSQRQLREGAGWGSGRGAEAGRPWGAGLCIASRGAPGARAPPWIPPAHRLTGTSSRRCIGEENIDKTFTKNKDKTRGCSDADEEDSVLRGPKAPDELTHHRSPPSGAHPRGGTCKRCCGGTGCSRRRRPPPWQGPPEPA